MLGRTGGIAARRWSGLTSFVSRVWYSIQAILGAVDDWSVAFRITAPCGPSMNNAGTGRQGELTCEAPGSWPRSKRESSNLGVWARRQPGWRYTETVRSAPLHTLTNCDAFRIEARRSSSYVRFRITRLYSETECGESFRSIGRQREVFAGSRETQDSLGAH